MSPAFVAGVAVERVGDEAGQAGRRASHGRFRLAVDRLGPEVRPRAQASPDTAALVDPAQGVFRLGQAHGHAANLGAESAQGEEHAPLHLETEGLGENQTRARDVDPQSRGGGMVPEPPSWLPAV